MFLRKQTKFKHGVSENGELQVYRIDEIFDDKDEVVIEKAYQPYSPKDPKNMEGFDLKSVEIVAAIEDDKIKADFESEFWANNGPPDPLETTIEIITFDRMTDDLSRIAVRRITRFYDDGKEIGKKHHRSWIMPGDDPSGNDVLSKALAMKLHTPEIVTAFKAKMMEQAKGL